MITAPRVAKANSPTASHISLRRFGAADGAAVWGGVTTAIAAPHLAQNFAPTGKGLPQSVHNPDEFGNTPRSSDIEDS